MGFKIWTRPPLLLGTLEYLYFYDIHQKCGTLFQFQHFQYFGHKLDQRGSKSQLDQRRSKYRSNLFQNDLFGNSFTNHGNFELKLGQYLYYNGILHKIRTLFKIWIIWTKFGPKKGQTLVLFGAKLHFWQYHH